MSKVVTRDTEQTVRRYAVMSTILTHEASEPLEEGEGVGGKPTAWGRKDLKTSATMGTVELTGLEMTRWCALGATLAAALSRERAVRWGMVSEESQSTHLDDVDRIHKSRELKNEWVSKDLTRST